MTDPPQPTGVTKPVPPVDALGLIAQLKLRGLTVAVAESLTGGLLIAELVAVAGASAVVNGGVVAYSTDLKHTVLGVSASVLAGHGPVHADVARQMADNVRSVLAVRGVPASIGLSTTGVAGPGPSDGHPAGTAFIAVAHGSDIRVAELRLPGDRDQIRRAVVSESLELLSRILAQA